MFANATSSPRSRPCAHRPARLVASCLLVATVLSAAPVRSARASHNPTMQRGISYAAWWAGEYQEPGSDLSLQALADTGANWISLIVTAYQDSYTSTSIDRTSAHTPTDADLIHVIQHAHALGLNVMLKPHLDLFDEFTSGYWRGDIGSGFTSEAQWSAWFDAYTGFIEHYAQLAQTYGADQFCVGTELLGTTHRTADWRAVIAGVRAIYDGPITYAALHSGEETRITWWDAVDYIGVDGYYPLASDLSLHPTVEELEAAWETPKALLADLSATYGKPILLTEIGYRSHHGCSAHPWDSNAVSPLDLEEQAFAYQAAFNQLYAEPWLAGMFWWNWYADRFKSGACDDSYSPYQKPAEDVLRAWYGGEPRLAAPPLVPDEGRVFEIYAEGLAPGWQNWSWSADVDLAASDPVYAGTQSAAVTLESWGALSLWRPGIDPGAYHWLEFYVRGSSEEQPRLEVFAHAADGTPLPPVPLNDCRYIANGTIPYETWRLVRIPLADLGVLQAGLSRLSVQDAGGQGSVPFWIDDVRLLGAREIPVRLFLPLVVRPSSQCP